MLTQKEQKELRAEVERLNTAFVGERNARENAEQRVWSLERKQSEFLIEMAALRGISIGFCNAVERQWFKSMALRNAIKAHQTHHGIK